MNNVKDSVATADDTNADVYRLRWGCISCDYIYKPPIGMGIHRVPIRCPACGGKIRGTKHR